MKAYILKTLVLSLATSIVLGMGACSSSSGGGGGDTDQTDTTDTTTETEVVTTLGSASLSGTLADSSSVVAGAVSRDLTIDPDASAELVLDLNHNGDFGDASDVKYSALVSTDGSFEFQDIAIPEDGTTDAQLSVSKSGFAPVIKIITLSDGQNSSIVAEAAAMPVYTEVIAIDKTAIAAGSYLKIGMKNTSSGVSSYAKIMSLNELRAEATDPSFGEDDLSTSVIPIDAVPDDVTEIKADMKAFDPTDPEDSKYFPGEYAGSGKDGSAEESRLVSVGFDLVSLVDQNGNPIELDEGALQTSKLRPQAITWENCLQTKVRYLSATQVSLIETMGDDDNTTTEFEIPMWYYNSSSGIWDYLGDAEYVDAATSTNGRAYANMCITENWGQYVNLDYDFTITQPKTICVQAKDDEDEIVDNLLIRVRKETSYNYSYFDASGAAKVALTAGDDLDSYEIKYNGYITGWTDIQVDKSTIVANTTNPDCDYDLNLVIQNPYSTTLQVRPLDINGSIGQQQVRVFNNSYYGYYNKVATADANGVTTFKIKPNATYYVQYRSKTERIIANGAVVDPETADNTRTLSVTIQDENFPPEVFVRFDDGKISEKATTVGFAVLAKDKNGDAITMESFTLNGLALVEGTHYTLNAQYQGRNYENSYGFLNLDNAELSAITPSGLSDGSYTLEAKYSDGSTTGTASATLEVLGDRAPIINGVYFYSSATGRYVNLRDIIPVGPYAISAYVYDPNGDDFALTYELDGVSTGADIDLTDGEHTIKVIATDLGGLSSSKTFVAFVGNHPPVVTFSGADTYLLDIASARNSVNLFAYVNDKEDGDEVKSVQAVDQNGTVYPFTYNERRWRYEAEITPAFVGTYTFDITATDNDDKNSTAQRVSIQTIANNQAPIFTNQITNDVVGINTEKTFECQAIDPEGSFVTYVWMINGVNINVFSSSYTYLFDTTGQVSIACTASDQDGESATTSGLITVTDPTQIGTLVVNTPMSGLVVAIHDSATMEPSGMEQETNATGSASFNLVGDRTTFSVSLTSDTILSKEVIFEASKSNLLAEAMSACDRQPDTNTTCSSMDWCGSYAGDSIPNWVAELNPPTDENGTIVMTIDQIDTNNNGSLDADEVYAATVLMDDMNGDNQVSWKEFNENRQTINTQLYSSIPVQEYTLGFEIQSTDWLVSNLIDFCTTPAVALEDFNLTLTGMAPGVNYSIFARGSGNLYVWSATADSAGASVHNVSVNKVGENGDYTYLLEFTDDSGVTTYTFLDANASTLAAGVTLDVSTFNTLTDVDVLYGTNIDERLSLSELYNGIYFSSGRNSYTPTGYKISLYPMTGVEYVISTDFGNFVTDIGWVEYYSNHYYGDGTLLSQYLLSDYPNLDLSLSAVDGGMEIGGNDFGKLNLMSNAMFSSGETYSFDFTMVSTQISSSIDDINVSKILPLSVQNGIVGFSQDLLLNSFVQGELVLSEYKGKTEVDILDDFTGVSTYNDYEYWLNIAQRSVMINQGGEVDLGGEVEMMSSALPTQESTATKTSKVENPFAIGLNVSKIW